MLRAIFTISLVLCTLFSYSQGRLNGVVADANGELLYGVIVRAEENSAVITQTDFDGIFSLKFPDDKEYTVRFYLVGYEELFVPIKVSNNETIKRDFILSEKVTTTQSVEIIGKAKKSADSFMEKKKMNSAITMDYISAETLKKTGDSNVISAIARVSGVSTNNGLITVRGIGDRYVRTTMNGSRIPTLDPLTNNIQLDIFPTTLVDNIVITKTASADLVSDWSGAYISVETKDYPDKLTIGIETQVGYNAQNTFKDFITSNRSNTDWLGFDSNYRNRESNEIVRTGLSPTIYQQFVALGLGDYFSQLGIQGWRDGSEQSDQYFRLGLVQLGLLPQALINDATAYQNAVNTYQNTYRPQAIERITPNGTNYDNGFNNDWDVSYRRAPLNFSQSFSIGNQTTLFGRTLGVIGGFRYGTNYRYDSEGLSQRVGNEAIGYPFLRRDNARVGRETNSWSALFNASYNLNANNKISVLFMPNFIGTNDVSRFREIPFPGDVQEVIVQTNIFYEQRRQLISQLSSQHFFPKQRLKVDVNLSYTDGKSIAPDFKALEYIELERDGVVTSYTFGPTVGEGIRRFYRYLTDNILDTRVDFEKNLVKEDSKRSRKIKFGAATQRNFRKWNNYEYRVTIGNSVTTAPLVDGNINAYMGSDKFTVTNGIADYFYDDLYFDRNHSFGYSNVVAGYGMADWEFTPYLRLSGGLRIEATDIFTDVNRFHELGYERDDVRRENNPGFPYVNPGEINRVDFLPNANLIFKFDQSKYGQTNLRFNFSRSIARPSIRELNDAAIYDAEFRAFVYGNSDLEVVKISNFDFRAETFFTNGDNVSVSAFYKRLQNHIELGFGTAGITWENIPLSTVAGIELEGKKSLGKSFELRANITFVKSEAEFVRRGLQIVNGRKEYTIIDTLFRPMFGQAPYLINAIASYKWDEKGFVLTASYNVQGPRLVIAGAIEGIANVFELPRNLIDVKASKTLGKHFSVSLTVRDILNAAVDRSYDLPTGWEPFDRFRYGTSFNLGIAYKY
jgi:hypothetical protein